MFFYSSKARVTGSHPALTSQKTPHYNTITTTITSRTIAITPPNSVIKAVLPFTATKTELQRKREDILEIRSKRVNRVRRSVVELYCFTIEFQSIQLLRTRIIRLTADFPHFDKALTRTSIGTWSTRRSKPPYLNSQPNRIDRSN